MGRFDQKGRVRRNIIIVAFATFVLINIALASLFLFHEVFDFTSSNSAIYLVKDKHGGYSIKRDLFLEEADGLVFMLDFNILFDYLVKGMAVAKQEPLIELTWDEDEGVGDIKQFREDGTIITLTFSRFMDGEQRPHGLFLGGELPYGDPSKSPDHGTSGFGYFDGNKWYHIWCSTNESFKMAGEDLDGVTPLRWKYLGSRVLKKTRKEVLLESRHFVGSEKNGLRVRRIGSFRAGDDFYGLKVVFENTGNKPVLYSYTWGDEPWIGSFGASRGDVGWHYDGLIEHEEYIIPEKEDYAGFWDYGNDAAGEPHNFSGVANFVEWFKPLPTMVFFSNNLSSCCDEQAPLASETDRVINLVWMNQMLLPGQQRVHTLAIGMARLDPATGTPIKPRTYEQ